MSQQPADQESRPSGHDQDDPSWGVCVADRVANSDIIAIVHGHNDQRGNDRADDDHDDNAVYSNHDILPRPGTRVLTRFHLQLRMQPSTPTPEA